MQIRVIVLITLSIEQLNGKYINIYIYIYFHIHTYRFIYVHIDPCI